MNEAFGWVWITVGLLWWAALAPAMTKEGWLGGYASRRRRLLRLGHIAMVALGLLNILFAHTSGGMTASDPLAWAGWLLMGGAVLMPTACAIVAWNRRLFPLFVPASLALIGGSGLTAYSLITGGVS